MDDKIKKCVKALIGISKKKKLESITVFELIKEAGIKRPTFYYYFGSIRDVIVAFYLEYPLANFHRIKNLHELTTRIAAHLDTQKGFNLVVSQSNYQGVLIEQIYQWAFLFFKNKYPEFKARFVSYGYANMLNSIYAREESNYDELLKIINTLK